MCPNSLKSHKCFNSECTYRWHLPHTIRIPNTGSRSFRDPQQHRPYKNGHRGSYTNARSKNNTYQQYWQQDANSFPPRNYNKTKRYTNDTERFHNDYYYQRQSDDPKGYGPQGNGWWEGSGMDGRSHTYGECNGNNTGNYNDKNISFSFLETLQGSIAHHIQETLQRIDLPSQITKELSRHQMQTTHNTDLHQQHPVATVNSPVYHQNSQSTISPHIENQQGDTSTQYQTMLDQIPLQPPMFQPAQTLPNINCHYQHQQIQSQKRPQLY